MPGSVAYLQFEQLTLCIPPTRRIYIWDRSYPWQESSFSSIKSICHGMAIHLHALIEKSHEDLNESWTSDAHFGTSTSGAEIKRAFVSVACGFSWNSASTDANLGSVIIRPSIGSLATWIRNETSEVRTFGLYIHDRRRSWFTHQNRSLSHTHIPIHTHGWPHKGVPSQVPREICGCLTWSSKSGVSHSFSFSFRNDWAGPCIASSTSLNRRLFFSLAPLPCWYICSAKDVDTDFNVGNMTETQPLPLWTIR